MLVATGVSISEGGTLDLADNDMIIQTADATAREAMLANITELIRRGRNTTDAAGKLWNGSGMISSAAAGDMRRLTGLGAIGNNRNDGTQLHMTFNGQAVDGNAVLVKYTWNGDVDLNGKVDADDYFRIDSGFLSGGVKKGYRNGDLDFSGKIDADDYFLVDSAFLGQSGVMAARAAEGVVAEAQNDAPPP